MSAKCMIEERPEYVYVIDKIEGPRGARTRNPQLAPQVEG